MERQLCGTRSAPGCFAIGWARQTNGSSPLESRRKLGVRRWEELPETPSSQFKVALRRILAVHIQSTRWPLATKDERRVGPPAIPSEIDSQIELNVSPRITVLVLPERGRVIDVRVYGSPVNPVESVLEQRTKTNAGTFGKWEVLVYTKILLHIAAHSKIRQLADIAKGEWSGC